MKTILVVEDFLHARDLICKKLQRKGYHTLAATSVQEAYDMLAHEADEINLVLSDINVSDTTDFDLLRMIKNNPTLENIPFVFWTTDFHSGNNIQEHESRASSFTQKQFRDRNFFKEIDRAIKTKGCMINLAS